MAFTTEITRGMIIMYNNEPHIIIDKEFYSPAKGGAFTKTKLKNVRTGKIIAQTFRSGEKLDSLDVETKTMQFLYSDETDAYFMDPISFEQINISLSQISGGTNYLHSEGKYIIMLFEDRPISIQMPLKISLKVTETSDGVKGNTATNATKDAILETGMHIQVPLFIKVGDKIAINTESDTYVSKDN